MPRFPEELIEKVAKAIFSSMGNHRGPEGFDPDYWYLHEGYAPVVAACRDDAVAALGACYDEVVKMHSREVIEIHPKEEGS